MKNNLFFVWMAVYLFLPSSLFGHGGRTDSLGCHNDRQRGGYHCHSGPLAGRSFASKAQATAALERLRSPREESSIKAQDTQLDEVKLKVSIEKLCLEYWPADSEMRAKCQDKQFKALAKLVEGKPSDISETQWKPIFDSCSKKQKNDFKLKWFCINYQLAVLRKAR